MFSILGKGDCGVFLLQPNHHASFGLGRGSGGGGKVG